MLHRCVLAIPTIVGAVIGPCKETIRKGEVIELIRFIDMSNDYIYVHISIWAELGDLIKSHCPLFYVLRLYDSPFHNSGRHIASNQVSLFNYAMEHDGHDGQDGPTSINNRQDAFMASHL